MNGRHGTCLVSSSLAILTCKSRLVWLDCPDRHTDISYQTSYTDRLWQVFSNAIACASLDGFYAGFEGHPLRKDFPLTVRSYL
jgi:hypothetical protein